MELAIKGLQQEYSELFDKVSVTLLDLERYRKVEQELQTRKKYPGNKKLVSGKELLGQYIEIKELKIGSEALKNLKRIILTVAYIMLIEQNQCSVRALTLN